MGKLGSTLIKSCEANFIDMSLVLCFHEFLLEYENKFEEKTFSDPKLHDCKKTSQKLNLFMVYPSPKNGSILQYSGLPFFLKYVKSYF